MSVWKPKKSSFYHFDFQFRGNRFHGSTGCTAKRDAERFESEERRKAALGDDVKPAITLNDAAGLWWSAKGQYLSSAATIDYQLANLIAHLGKKIALADIDLTMLDGYISYRRASVKNSSVNREIELLRSVINFARRRKFDAPDIEWKELRLKEAPTKTRVLTAEEQARLFEALPDSLKPLVEFAIISGQRKNEIVKLLWADVDFTNMRATVLVKGGQIHSFPLTPRLRDIIAQQPKAAPQVFTYIAERTSPRRPDRPARLKGCRYPFSKQGWDRKWRKALKDAGIEGYRFHDNRHTAASRTGRIETAFQLLGHSDIRTTKRYFHTAEDEVRAAMMEAETKASEPDAPERKQA